MLFIKERRLDNPNDFLCLCISITSVSIQVLSQPALIPCISTRQRGEARKMTRNRHMKHPQHNHLWLSLSYFGPMIISYGTFYYSWRQIIMLIKPSFAATRSHQQPPGCWWQNGITDVARVIGAKQRWPADGSSRHTASRSICLFLRLRGSRGLLLAHPVRCRRHRCRKIARTMSSVHGNPLSQPFVLRRIL
jgi:hypothetical protein